MIGRWDKENHHNTRTEVVIVYGFNDGRDFLFMNDECRTVPAFPYFCSVLDE